MNLPELIQDKSGHGDLLIQTDSNRKTFKEYI